MTFENYVKLLCKLHVEFKHECFSFSEMITLLDDMNELTKLCVDLIHVNSNNNFKNELTIVELMCGEEVSTLMIVKECNENGEYLRHAILEVVR